jgi:hypothetical protein
VPVPGMQMSRSTAHAAVPAAFAWDAARAVAAAHQAGGRAGAAQWRSGQLFGRSLPESTEKTSVSGPASGHH